MRQDSSIARGRHLSLRIDNWPRRTDNFYMVAPDLLEILVCPACKKPLTLQEDKDHSQSLKCGECRRVYPIRDDIPILLLDEATIDPS